TARHLHDKGLGRMIVANRTLARAHEIAETFSGFAIELDELPAHLNEADIIIASTASPTAIVSHDMAQRALNPKRRKPIFMVDLAVPRDIESTVGGLEDVYLYTIDDLQGVIEESQRARRAAAEQADEIISQQTATFRTRLRALDVAPLIQNLRADADTQREAVLAKAQRMLAAGKPSEDVLHYLAQALTNRLLHLPSKQLRQAALDDDTELLEQARRLFKLK
ncbi:MAG TPA: glutamyl-tRNA reductase, partial [Gammaproteobacteria bacterium]|nr:glutamyl-tRNA reductase [Gammaproteobacteria bacterium]